GSAGLRASERGNQSVCLCSYLGGSTWPACGDRRAGPPECHRGATYRRDRCRFLAIALVFAAFYPNRILAAGPATRKGVFLHYLYRCCRRVSRSTEGFPCGLFRSSAGRADPFVVA